MCLECRKGGPWSSGDAFRKHLKRAQGVPACLMVKRRRICPFCHQDRNPTKPGDKKPPMAFNTVQMTARHALSNQHCWPNLLNPDNEWQPDVLLLPPTNDGWDTWEKTQEAKKAARAARLGLRQR